ncbi:MAG: sulfotransferase [Actinomycetota bacterium]|nr:sulfotransferase [Actinomycetota bacterium]
MPRAKLRGRQLLHVPGLLAGGQVERPIFIVGAPRSGTTLLFRVLAASRRVATWWPMEAHEIWEADHHPALHGWESNVLNASDANSKSMRRIRREFYLVTGNHRRLLDKTPRNVMRVPFIDAVFPDAVYVFLKRDGRDTINSLINAWRSDRYRTYELPEPLTIPGVDPRWWKFVLYPGWREDTSGSLERVCARQWVHSNERMLDARGTIESSRWTELSYETFTDDPVTATSALVDFLDLPFDKAIQEKAEAVKTTIYNAVTPPERGKWRKENPSEIEAIIPLIAPTMERLGYSPSTSSEQLEEKEPTK